MSKLSRSPSRKSYDYVVVGSGSAGSIVAARLAEDPQTKVLLLEAGPSDKHIFIRMPAAFGMPLQSDKFNWFYHGEPEPYLNNRSIYEARGRVLGGSSSINGMNWVRGNPWDYDNWAAMGLDGWSYADCLPYFRRAETFDRGEDAYRGGHGPMHIQTSPGTRPLYRSFFKAAEEVGLPTAEDHNGYRQDGAHRAQRNVKKGVRCSTSYAYIHEQPRRPNLDVVIGALVTKINFSDKRATGVQVRIGDQITTIAAEREVVLCGGAINSPQLLLLSGIGNADGLKKLSIPLVAHVPGVGEHLADHLAAPVQYTVTKDEYSQAKDLGYLSRVRLAAEWLIAKRGLGVTNFFEVGAFFRTSDDYPVPNIQIEFIPLIGELQHGSLRLESGFQYFMSLMRPKSRGRVWLKSADPTAAPAFVFNHLQHPEDQQQAIEAIRFIRKIIAQPAWNEMRGVEQTPGVERQSDAEILEFLREHGSTNYHPACSCRMGRDDMSVVDEKANVHGLEGLRVADASIMPEIVSGNLNAPTVMIGEKVADLIRGRRLVPTPMDYYRHPVTVTAG